MLEYKYVIGGSNNDYYRVAYQDVIKKDANITYVAKRITSDSAMINWIYNHHFSPNINSIVPLPFKSIWNGMYLKHSYDAKDKICFLLFASYSELIPYGLICYLRRKYPNCRIVCFFQDLVKKLPKHIDPWRHKEIFDLVLSFDQRDCQEYGFTYYPLVYSKVDVPDDLSLEQSDVFFVGKAKDRMDEIIGAYRKLKDAGLRCDFHIVDTDPKERMHEDEIHYCRQMSYEENLRRIKKSRCLLEIMQKDGHGYTLRCCEAIAMGKRLMTNNVEISHAPFFREDRISVFDKPENIRPEFVKEGPDFVDYAYLDELSPMKLLQFVDCHLSGKG